MDRRSFLARSVALPMAFASAEADPATILRTTLADATQSMTPDHSSGPDFNRYRLTLDRVLHGADPAYTSEFLLEDIHGAPGRRFTNFSGDLSGRWIGALSTSALVFGDSFPGLHDIVARTIALQHGDGYFGLQFHFDHPSDDDLALLWGNGRLLVGLMEYYTLTQDTAVLDSAKRLGDFLIRIGPRFNSQEMADAFSAAHYASSYICWTQQTEGLAALYKVTRDDRYKELCSEISYRIERRPGDHVHGYLSSLRGELELYNATGDAAHLGRVVAAWQDVMRSGDILITGGVPERWTPKRERTEGCAECDWLRLDLSLYRATGESIYLERAHDVYFNDFSMNQFSTGDFGHAKLDGGGVPQIVYIRAWWCCTLHGLRAFADVRSSAFRAQENTVTFALPVDSSIDTGTFSATAKSRLSTEGSVLIEINKATEKQSFAVYQPSWASTVSLLHNGKEVRGTAIQQVARGDVVSVRYGMSLRSTERLRAASLTPHKAIRFGPWLLGAASTHNPKYFNELYPDNQLHLSTAHRPAMAGSPTFEVPIAAHSVGFTPAEFPEQPAVVELRAVAEQTANLPADWQLAFISST